MLWALREKDRALEWFVVTGASWSSCNKSTYIDINVKIVESRDRGSTRRTGGELKREKPTAVITGTAQGIGRRTAEVLAERGFRVALNDLRMPDETLRSIQSRGGEAIAHVGNVADESVVEELVRTVFEAWGRADV